jgi:hypothetical protein
MWPFQQRNHAQSSHDCAILAFPVFRHRPFLAFIEEDSDSPQGNSLAARSGESGNTVQL